MTNLRWSHMAEDVVRAVAGALSAALPGMRVQCMETLSDGPHDTPLLQVHWFGDSWDPHGGGDTDRTTFGMVRQMNMDIQLWAFIRQRSLFGEDQAGVIQWGDRIRDALFAQGVGVFGTVGSPRIQACGYRIEPVTWTVGGDRRFSGARYHLSLRVY